MTTFEGAADYAEEAARCYREAGKAPNLRARDYWLAAADNATLRAKEAARFAVDAFEASIKNSRLTVKECILQLLPKNARDGLPVRMVAAGLMSMKAVDYDAANIRRHLRELESAGRVGAVLRRTPRAETVYFLKSDPPPPMASAASRPPSAVKD